MAKSLGTIGFRKCGDWKPKTRYRKDDMVKHKRSSMYALEDHESGEEFDPTKWEYLADASGVEEITVRAEEAATLAETNGEEAGLQAEAAKEAAKEATEQTEAAKEATGLFTENFKTLTSDEFAYAIADSLGNLLWGIRRDGSIHQPKGMPEETKQRFKELSGFQLMENDKYVFAITDTNDNVLFGIDKNGASVVNSITGVFEVKQFEGSEFIFCVMDSAENLLFGVKRDGTFYASKFTLPNDVLKQLEKVSGNALETDDKDKEFIYKVTDKDGRIVFGVQWDGTSYLPKGIPEDVKKYIKGADKRLTDLEKRLANFVGGAGDWSEASSMQIPVPRCAVMNLLTERMPTAKSGLGTAGVTCDIPCEVEFWDMQGNYFKKWVLLSAQGNSSMAFIKKNLAMDFFVDRSMEDEFKIKFGDWVSQDSFHFKAYYTDTFRGKGAVSYMVCEEIAKSRPMNDDRPYKSHFTGGYGMADQGTKSSIADLDKNFDTGAKCFPMGFPVIIYWKGEFYGVYAFQLKKHRDNFWQDKKTAEHVHLDGTLGADSIWGGEITWSSFEVRNPKNLFNHADGSEYDGDRPKEIMGSDSEHYDGSDKDMKRCAKVKQYIIDLSGRMAELKAEESSWAVDSINSAKNTLLDLPTHSSSVGLGSIPYRCFTRDMSHIVYLAKDNNGEVDATFISNINNVVTQANSVAKFVGLGAEAPKYETLLAYEDGEVLDKESINEWLAAQGIEGADVNFDGVSGAKEVYIDNGAVTLGTPSSTYPYIKVINLADFSAKLTEYQAMANDAMRALIGKYFKVSFMIDYILETNVVNDGDGYAKNWQWTTWDGVQWTANAYDHDGIFGANHIGIYVSSPGSGWLGNSTSIPSGWIIKYFLPELKTRYAELRDMGIFNATHIARLLYDWCDRVGFDNWEAEYEKWDESPCNRDSLINEENWTRSTGYTTAWAETTKYSKGGIAHKANKVWKSLVSDNIGIDPVEDDGTNWEDVFYDEERDYVTGDVCYYGNGQFYGFKCLADCTGIAPVSGFYNNYPKMLGHYDSVYRVENWLVQRIKYMDKFLNYNQ